MSRFSLTYYKNEESARLWNEYKKDSDYPAIRYTGENAAAVMQFVMPNSTMIEDEVRSHNDSSKGRIITYIFGPTNEKFQIEPGDICFRSPEGYIGVQHEEDNTD